MKLHHVLDERKHNIQQDYSVLKQVIANSYGAMGPASLSGAIANTEINPIFLNSFDREFKTPIQEDNVLVFGHNPEWNQEVAIIIQDAFAIAGKRAEIISANMFFSIEIEERRKTDIFYIIICNDIHLYTKKLSALRDFTSTRILFKIPGIEWQPHRLKVLVNEAAKEKLAALGVDSGNAVSVGLLASLGAKEFCVATDQKVTKRKLQ